MKKNILAIGNSFSEDSTVYLHAMATASGISARIVNLFIGGCSLERHCANMDADAAEYRCDIDGITGGEDHISISAALSMEDWDVVTLQQASPLSGIAESYYPHITRLAQYVRAGAPNARLYVNQTWAYETDCAKEGFRAYGFDQQTMYRALRAAYAGAAESIGASLIPCGDAVQALRALPEFDYPAGGQTLCRDGTHLHLLYGRFAAAAVWYETLLGGDVRKCPWQPQGADERLIGIIRETVHALCAKG